MKKVLKLALNSFCRQNTLSGTFTRKRDVMNEIRAISDTDFEFEDWVFEVGCDALAKEYLKIGRMDEVLKHVGNVMFVLGMAGFILGSCGYDGNPVICGAIALIGLAVAYAGYRIVEGRVSDEK